MRVEIVVDELVLSGFDPRDRLRVVDALERELAAAIVPDGVGRLAMERRFIDAIGPIEAMSPVVGRPPASRETTRAEPAALAKSLGDAIASSLAGAARST